MLRDDIGINLDDDFKFATIFKKTKECVCLFAEDAFQTLPLPHELAVFGKTYRALLREQWFILPNRLAKLYHETLPKRLDT